MHSLGNHFIKLVWRRKTSLLGLLLVTLLLGGFTRLSYQQFIYLQAQNVSGLSVFNEIILPLAGLTILCQLGLSLLACVQLSPSFHARGQVSLLEQASISPAYLGWSLLWPVALFSLWPLLNFCLICLSLSFISAIDLSRLVALVLGLEVICLLSGLVFLLACLRSRQILVAIIQSLFILFALLVLEAGQKYLFAQDLWIGIFLPFLDFREGLFIYSNIAGYLGWLVLLSCLLVMTLRRKVTRLNKSLPLFVLLGFAGVIFSAWIPGSVDLSENRRSSMSNELIDNYRAFKAEHGQHKLKLLAVIDEQTSRDEIMRGFSLIKRVIPETEIEFISRQSLVPQLQQVGEYVQFKLAEMQQSVSYPFEQEVKLVFESALAQMLRRKKHWISFIEGHGEASLFAENPSDLGEFYRELRAAGWDVAAQNLALQPLIADNTGLIVIASGKQQWLSGEIESLLDYLRKGGNLLVLVDPDSLLPEAIQSYIGISRLPGTLIDWNGYQSGTPHPAIVVINQPSEHPIAKPLKSLLAFPWSSGLQVSSAQENISFEAILSTHSGVWNESEINQDNLSFDRQQGELQQSFALAISRYNPKNQQKIVVVGDSHFLSDSAINNYANKQFALNIISWLTSEQAVLEQSLAGGDHYLEPLRWGRFALNWFFCLVLPLVILAIWSGLRWHRYLRQSQISGKY